LSEYCRQLVASGILQWPSARQKAPSHAFSESLFHLETHVEDLPEAVTAYYRYLGMGRGVSYIPYHMGVWYGQLFACTPYALVSVTPCQSSSMWPKISRMLPPSSSSFICSYCLLILVRVIITLMRKCQPSNNNTPRYQYHLPTMQGWALILASHAKIAMGHGDPPTGIRMQ
jgi:hypothetical protein